MVIIWCDGVRLKANQSCDVTPKSTDEIGSTTNDTKSRENNQDAPEELLPVTLSHNPATPLSKFTS